MATLVTRSEDDHYDYAHPRPRVVHPHRNPQVQPVVEAVDIATMDTEELPPRPTPPRSRPLSSEPPRPAVVPRIRSRGEGRLRGILIYELSRLLHPRPDLARHADATAVLGQNGSGWIYQRSTEERSRQTQKIHLSAAQICQLYAASLDAMANATANIPEPDFSDQEGA